VPLISESGGGNVLVAVPEAVVVQRSQNLATEINIPCRASDGGYSQQDPNPGEAQSPETMATR